MLMIDPPGGWNYGFPKPVPKDVLKDVSELVAWLLREGYPSQGITLALKHSRVWEAPDATT